jgi:hypothetical protein
LLTSEDYVIAAFTSLELNLMRGKSLCRLPLFELLIEEQLIATNAHVN